MGAKRNQDGAHVLEPPNRKRKLFRQGIILPIDRPGLIGVRPRHCMNSRHGLPVLSKHRIIASQNRSPQKPAASALKPAAHTTNTKPISKDGAYCHARMMPQRTPRIAPQVNCFQKLSLLCLYSSGVMSRNGLTSSATRRSGRNDCNHDAHAGFAVAHA